MAAHSACDFGGGKAEKLALAKYRQTIWQGRVLNSQFTDKELRSQGRCPLTPEEVGLLLAALGFDNNTRLYLASHKVHCLTNFGFAALLLFPTLSLTTSNSLYSRYMEGKLGFPHYETSSP
ncbi:hypothetical protein Goklo_020918 [Gossypium klotzschianum]|nr:hypothetical protein [Gossypium klotzschianum]